MLPSKTGSMQLGFVSAILPELSLEEVFACAAEMGYDCVELMCWPEGKAERRYAGVTHINADRFTQKEAKRIQALAAHYGVAISGLGYYPNPLSSDRPAAQTFIRHIKKVIKAAALLDVRQMNTFIGRDHRKSVDDNWPQFLRVWKNILAFSEKQNVRIGIENCPMIFTDQEWPGGKNLATTPAIWRRMFKDIPSNLFGLNFDPSHFIIQHMDYLSAMRQFSDKLFHIHAKDVRIDTRLLNEHGIMSPPNLWHTPKLPGMGDVNWGQFFSTLTSIGYDGAVCVEVEDRAYEGSLEKRKIALKQSLNYLRQYVVS